MLPGVSGLSRAHLHGESLGISRFEFEFFFAESPFDVPVAARYVHRLIVRLQQQWKRHQCEQRDGHDRDKRQPLRDDVLLAPAQCEVPARKRISPFPHEVESRRLGRSSPGNRSAWACSPITSQSKSSATPVTSGISSTRMQRSTRHPAGEGVRLHDLRHTCASLAISAGANVTVVQKLLGFKTAVLRLDRNGHLLPDDLDAMGVAFDSAAATTAEGTRPQSNQAPSKGGLIRVAGRGFEPL